MVTLEEVREHVGRPAGTILCTDDINQVAPFMDFEDWLRARLETDISIAQRKMRWNGEAVVLQKKVDHAQLVLTQLDWEEEDRDIMVHLEIEGLRGYFNKLSSTS